MGGGVGKTIKVDSGVWFIASSGGSEVHGKWGRFSVFEKIFAGSWQDQTCHDLKGPPFALKSFLLR
jgi:hypothetical protein